MFIEKQNIHPNCPFVTRTVEVGGLTKSQLIEKLKQNAILLNEYGEKLLADKRFTVSNKKYTLQTVELTVGDLGFSKGAATPQVFKRAKELDLELCPLELGPYLRLQYTEEPEVESVNTSQQNQAPSGSITIASEKLTEDDEFPNGFYLRRMKGELWLRGYRADDLHVWSGDDRFIFCYSKFET